MSLFDWQTAAAMGLLAWAVVHITRASLRVMRKKQEATSCGGCGTCSSNSISSNATAKSATPPNFVGIETLRRLN